MSFHNKERASTTPPTHKTHFTMTPTRWGGDGWVHGLRQSARKDGLKFGKRKWWPHTLLAHTLLEHTKRRLGLRACDALKGVLFRMLCVCCA